MKGEDRISQITSPLFTPESGDRMRLVRQKMLLDQAELGDLLGISQQQVSKVEQGKISQVTFTLARFKAVFGKFYTFILFGTQVSSDNWSQVRRQYWDVRLRVRRNREPGSGAHRRGAKGTATIEETRDALEFQLKQSDKKGS